MKLATLRGCVNHAHPASPFSDSLSPLGLGAFQDNRAGVDRAYLKGLHVGSYKPAFQPFLQAAARVAGVWEDLHVETRECMPWGWCETCRAGDAQVRVTVTIPHAARLSVAIAPVSGRCDGFAFDGAVRAEMGTLEVRQRAAPELVLHRQVHNVFLKTECSFDLHFRIPGARITACDSRFPDAETVWSDAGGPFRRFRVEVPVAPDGSAELVMELQIDDTLVPVGILASSAERWQNWIDRLPCPEPATEFWKQRFLQAVQVVASAAVRMPGYGNFGEEVTALASVSNWSSSAFFWDHIFSSGVLGLMEPDWQESAIRCHTRHATRARITPGILLAFPLYGDADNLGDCYAPIAAWSIMKAPHMAGDTDRLRAVYPFLKANVDSWFLAADRDGDGIPEWRNTGNPADNSPLYDAYAPKPGATCFPIPPFVSVNLCAYLLMEMRCLREIARRVGLADDAIAWEERASKMDRYILENLWDENDLFFYDRTPDGGVTRIKTFFGLLPLWAGVSLPVETARRAIEAHLLNPDEFWGAVPFPSVAYNEPSYDPSGYWRGRSWPHLYFWNTEILWAYGYHAEAAQAKRRFLELNACWAGPAENFPTDSNRIDEPGMLNYNWGAAALVFFLLKWHEQPLAMAGRSAAHGNASAQHEQWGCAPSA